MKEQVVLSLFNGMNTLRQAMENVGIPVKKYYSSEIKPYAIKLTQHHFPDTIQLGDITKWREWDIDWSEITFIGSGSPCQDLSVAGNRAGVINGEKSSLFFTFIEILNHCKKLNPDVKFLQENVGSANTADIGIMSRELGVYPVRINSELGVSSSLYLMPTTAKKLSSILVLISKVPLKFQVPFPSVFVPLSVESCVYLNLVYPL